ncbi:sialidase-1-like [Asterias amurensis]|uniref:sialidase-1-like n=1 Tax=Asterias amurensis TaxID=7602 RepID=UPI003AB38465
MATLGRISVLAAVIFSSFLPSFAVFSPRVVETQLLWEPNIIGDVSCYRIPIITRLPTGSLIAFSEARKFSTGDSGAKFLAYRTSDPDVRTNSGAGDLWSLTQFLIDDYQATDGLNLGAVIVDKVKNYTIVLYSVCAHTACPATGNLRGNYMKRSKDFGKTWEPPADISRGNAALRNLSWSAGPGYGIQKMHAPHKGRLIACGHANDLNSLSMFCVVSDDHGDSWKKAGTVFHLPYRGKLLPGDFAPTEVQMVELANGTILFNARSEGRYRCACRIIMMSYDGAETIPMETVRIDTTLIDPTCAGSVLLHNDMMFFTNAASSLSRINLTLRWSANAGLTWAGSLVINPGVSEYSCLTVVDDNHIGIVYEEGSNGLWFVKVRLNS